MPQILHDPPTRPILQLRIQHPPPIPLILAPPPPQHLRPRHGKLRAARGADLARGLRARKQLPPYLRRHVRVIPLLHLTPGVPVAAQIDVAVAAHEVGAQFAEGVDVVVEGGVGVPGGPEAVAARVDEGHDGGEGVVVLDYVGEVGHGFVAFVGGGVEGGVRVVDCVDGVLPAVGGEEEGFMSACRGWSASCLRENHDFSACSRRM